MQMAIKLTFLKEGQASECHITNQNHKQTKKFDLLTLQTKAISQFLTEGFTQKQTFSPLISASRLNWFLQVRTSSLDSIQKEQYPFLKMKACSINRYTACRQTTLKSNTVSTITQKQNLTQTRDLLESLCNLFQK